MARNRRGPEIRGTLGTLLRTTLQQASVVRDAIGRSVDEVRRGGRRQEVLAELGEVVLELVQRGEIDLDELPEARPLVEELLGGDAPARREVATPPSRSRFDDRSDGTVSSAKWSPPKVPASKVWKPEPKKGGISFDDDSDLAEYMHPDDVPPKDGDA